MPNLPLFLAPTAAVMGRVQFADDVSVWYGAVIRADVEEIRIGARSNIQDTAVLHADPGSPTHIGPDVTVGHGAIVHAATIGEGTLVGMRATVLNRAVVGRFCLIGAHALVLEDTHIPDYSLVLGAPAKVVRTLDPAEAEALLLASAAHYVELARLHAAGKFKLMP